MAVCFLLVPELELSELCMSELSGSLVIMIGVGTHAESTPVRKAWNYGSPGKGPLTRG